MATKERAPQESRKSGRNGGSPPRKIPANRLQRLRERHRRDGGFYLTMAEMARLRGVSESLVSRHESGERGLTPVDVAEYAKILKVDPMDLFPGLTVKEPTPKR